MVSSDVGTTERKKLTPRQRLALFEKHKGICAICKVGIRTGEKWIVEHLRPLALGGDNSESNLAPVHANCAYEKTHGKEGDLAKAAKAKRTKMAALGIKKESGPKIESRGFAKVEKPSKTPRSELPALPRRSLYTNQ